MKNIAIFASGNGSNAQNIVKYFKNNLTVNVSLILTNNSEAFVLERAKQLNIPSFVFKRKDFYESNLVLDILTENKINFIVLAGFLWLVPKKMLKKYPNRIINIHPALLPKYGGKGMYGARVHQEVYESGDTETGITIHYVNERYDEGEIIFQKKIPIDSSDTPDIIAEKIHILEHEYFPKIIENCVLSNY